MSHPPEHAMAEIRQIRQSLWKRTLSFISAIPGFARDSLNGKNAAGATTIAAIVGILGNEFLSTATPTGTVVFTTITNLLFAIPTFRQVSKSVSKIGNEMLGQNAPMNSSGLILFYRHGVPFLLIAVPGGAALLGYGVSTFAAYELSQATSPTIVLGLTDIAATGIGWASSIIMPLGTLVTNLWWNKKVQEVVKSKLLSDPSYIENIDMAFPELSKLERLNPIELENTIILFGEANTNEMFFKLYEQAANKSIKDAVDLTQVITTSKETLNTLTQEELTLDRDKAVIQFISNKLDESTKEIEILNQLRSELKIKADKTTINEVMRKHQDQITLVQNKNAALRTKLLSAKEEEAKDIERTMKSLDKEEASINVILKKLYQAKQHIDKLDSINKEIEGNKISCESLRKMDFSLSLENVKAHSQYVRQKKTILTQLEKRGSDRITAINSEKAFIEIALPGQNEQLSKALAIKERVSRDVTAAIDQVPSSTDLGKKLRELKQKLEKPLDEMREFVITMDHPEDAEPQQEEALAKERRRKGKQKENSDGPISQAQVLTMLQSSLSKSPGTDPEERYDVASSSSPIIPMKKEKSKKSPASSSTPVKVESTTMTRREAKAFVGRLTSAGINSHLITTTRSKNDANSYQIKVESNIEEHIRIAKEVMEIRHKDYQAK
jgi:hypothetical protein